MLAGELGGELGEPISERTQTDEAMSELQYLGLTSEFLKVAEFMGEDSDRRIFRRFDELRVYVLLRLQHRLTTLATKLEELEKEYDEREAKGYNDNVKDKELNDLVAVVGSVLKEYDDAFWSQKRFESLRSPSTKFMSDFISFYGSKYPVLPKYFGASHEKAARKTALVFTAVKEKSAAHRFVDKHTFLQRLFAVESKREKDSSQIFIYSESAISRVERTLVHVSFCILLLCPIIALSVMESETGKLAVVITFLLLAAFLTSGVLTGANNAGLAVLAGYGAILIFFLGIKVDFSK